MYSRKSYPIGFLFTQKNGCGGAISVTERSWASHIGEVFVPYFGGGPLAQC